MKILHALVLVSGLLMGQTALAGSHFTVNKDGTVNDKNTGLTWSKNANCFGAVNWEGANAAVAALNKGEKSCKGLTAKRTDWRLPTRAELETLLDKSKHDSGLSLPAKHPFAKVERAHYWTGETETGKDSVAWYVNLHNGHVDSTGKQESYYLWPVAGKKQ